MPGFIDLHNHILPAIDDGPRTLSESVQLARAMVRAGYTTVVATPHAMEGRPGPQEITGRLEELQAELDRLKVPLKLLPGAENHIDPDLGRRLRAGESLTLAGSRYLLLELPMLSPLPIYTEQLIFNLTVHGYCPVIPHPERVAELQKNQQLIYRLHKAGAVFQLTWGALPGWLGTTARRTALAMVRANLGHLFATDTHNPTSRLLTLSQAAAALDETMGPGSAEQLLKTRPRSVIDNLPLELPAPRAMSTPRPKKRFPFFR